MNENNEKHEGFKIFADESSPGEPEDADILLDESMIAPAPETPYTAGAPPKSEKPSRSGRFGAFLKLLFFLCAMSAIGAGAYAIFDHFDRRLNQIETAGAHEMAGLSKEIEDQMWVVASEFAEQHAEMLLRIEALSMLAGENAAAVKEMKGAMDAQVQALSRNVAGLENRMGALDRQIRSVETGTAGKVAALEKRLDAQTDAAEAAREAAAALSAVRSDLNGIRERIDAQQYDDMITENRARLAEMSRNITEISRDMTGINQGMAEMNRDLNRRIEMANRSVTQQIAALENEISALEAMMISFRNLTLQKEGLPIIIEQDLEDLP